jgi:hypothetical protein
MRRIHHPQDALAKHVATKNVVRSKYDWDSIRTNFINGIDRGGEDRWYPSLKELAEHHQVPGTTFKQRYARIRKMSSDERWPNKKDAAQMVLMQKRQKERIKAVAKHALDFDDRAHTAAKTGMAMVMTRLSEIAAQTAAHKPLRDDAIERLRNGEPVSKAELYSQIRSQELLELANAADRWQQIGMRALGTDVHKVDINGMVGDTTNVLVNVNQELARDDADRLGQVIEGMRAANLLPPDVAEALTTGQDKGVHDIVDAEVVTSSADESEDVHEYQQEGTPGVVGSVVPQGVRSGSEASPVHEDGGSEVRSVA